MRHSITVILPVYNPGTEYLRLSIESVLNQTMEDFEFIICDDCSTDDSYETISSYTDHRINKIRNEKNLGLFETLNKMIKMSKGSLIKLWSQDDIMMPECLEETVAFHNRYQDISFSYSDRIYIDEHGNKTGGNTLENDNTPSYIDKKMH